MRAAGPRPRPLALPAGPAAAVPEPATVAGLHRAQPLAVTVTNPCILPPPGGPAGGGAGVPGRGDTSSAVLAARLPVIGSLIHPVSGRQALQRVQAWAQAGESRYVCACNVHMAVIARGDARFRDVILRADLVLPDGAPIAWMLRRHGVVAQERVSGPDLMWDYMALAARSGEAVFLLGGTPAMLQALQARLRERWPALRIAGAESPPFRPLTAEEDEALVARINASGAATVWVGLGCPKQEQWMGAHRGRVQAVMVGVGAAFAFHAGWQRRAPLWMQLHGLEWLHRLGHEPVRLWRRYLTTNTLFLAAATLQLAAARLRRWVLGPPPGRAPGGR